MNIISKQFKKAMEEGRKCENCGYMISKPNWKKGHRLCAGCFSAFQGVNVPHGHKAYQDEPIDQTGNSL